MCEDNSQNKPTVGITGSQWQWIKDKKLSKCIRIIHILFGKVPFLKFPPELHYLMLGV